MKVLPEPLHDRTATRGLPMRADKMSFCFAQRWMPKVCLANFKGSLRMSRWLSLKSFIGGTGLRWAADRTGLTESSN